MTLGRCCGGLFWDLRGRTQIHIASVGNGILRSLIMVQVLQAVGQAADTAEDCAARPQRPNATPGALVSELISLRRERIIREAATN